MSIETMIQDLVSENARLRETLQYLYDDWQGPLTEVVRNAQTLLATADQAALRVPTVASALAMSFIETEKEIEIMRPAQEPCSCCSHSCQPGCRCWREEV